MGKEENLNFSNITELSSNFIDYVLAFSINNLEFIKKIRNIVSLDMYKSKEKKAVAKCLYNFYDLYKKPIGLNLMEVFSNYEKNLGETTYENAIKLISHLKNIQLENEQYFLDKIEASINHQKIEKSIIEAAKAVKVGEYDKAYEIFTKTIRETSNKKSNYSSYFDDTDYIVERSKGKTFDMKTIKDIDLFIGGFCKPWVVVYLGTGKSGKSFWLSEMAILSASQGLNTLFISLEMSKKQVEQRFDQITGFLGTDPGKEVETLEYSKGKWIKTKKIIPTIYDLELVKKSRRLTSFGGGKLYISDQNGIKCNYKDIDNLIEEIEQKENIKLDVVITDYLGEMGKTDKGQDKKTRITENCLGIKSIAKERNQIHFTAQQGNREAMKAEVFSSDLISDAIEPVFIADMILSICQSEEEEAQNIARLYIAENRHGKKHISIPHYRDFSIGQVFMDKAPMLLEPKKKFYKKTKLKIDDPTSSKFHMEY